VLIQQEQERCSGTKEDLEQDLIECRKRGARLEDVRSLSDINTVEAARLFLYL
jgi:hypothetical protein